MDNNVKAEVDRTSPYNYVAEVLPVPLLAFGLTTGLVPELAIKVTSTVASWTAVFVRYRGLSVG